MFYEIFEWLKTITIFVIFCETLLGFAPSVEYKKYLKPFAGLLILLKITAFLMGDMNEKGIMNFNEILSEYQYTVGEIVNPESEIRQMIPDEDSREKQGMQIQIDEISNISISPVNW